MPQSQWAAMNAQTIQSRVLTKEGTEASSYHQSPSTQTTRQPKQQEAQLTTIHNQGSPKTNTSKIIVSYHNHLKTPQISPSSPRRYGWSIAQIERQKCITTTSQNHTNQTNPVGNFSPYQNATKTLPNDLQTSPIRHGRYEISIPATTRMKWHQTTSKNHTKPHNPVGDHLLTQDTNKSLQQGLQNTTIHQGRYGNQS